MCNIRAYNYFLNINCTMYEERDVMDDESEKVQYRFLRGGTLLSRPLQATLKIENKEPTSEAGVWPKVGTPGEREVMEVEKRKIML